MTVKWWIEMRGLKSPCRVFLGKRLGKRKIRRSRNSRRMKLNKYCIVAGVSGVELPNAAILVLIKNTPETVKKTHTHNFCFSKSVVFT
jgi:hypothetical protein